MSEGMEQFREKICGCEISIKRKGKGKKVLFLHGGRGAPVWLPFMEELSNKFELYVPEHPGYGQSDTPEWLDKMEDVGYFYLELIEHFKMQDIHLVGSSIGGWIAAEMCIRNTNKIKSLVLAAPAGLSLQRQYGLDPFISTDDEFTRNAFYDQKLAEGMINQEVDEAAMDLILKNKTTGARLTWKPRIYSPQMEKWLFRIRIPTLIISGSHDNICPLEQSKLFNKKIEGSQLAIIENCGHLPHVEKKDEYCDLITNFIME